MSRGSGGRETSLQTPSKTECVFHLLILLMFVVPFESLLLTFVVILSDYCCLFTWTMQLVGQVN